jgi:hypothetical protein
MIPVIDALKDQAPFLKHNFKSPAIAWLRTEHVSIENDI